ncbi:TonB family protein [Mucilaginibacter sabulilitoris]|uniref:TonB family protein n=1 Tax=Mucilaginibacter sabulilitoris TaxID=1173583 RepID=A0ABZ0TT81_9SPHI|nr:TonB family protein [Mucilaginibacter sabulilitoris]WPU96211.1 TonB family protein [Mucilaginibacter sabulilitoris]
MLITKLNLYNAEWLDLVFDHRNKEYGAYDLRQHYGRNMTKAMALTFTGVAILVAASIIFKPKPAERLRIIEVPLMDIKTIKQEKLIEKPKPAEAKPAAPLKPVVPVQTVQNLPPVVVPNDPPIDPHTTAELQNSVISNVDSKGAPGGTNVLDGKADGGNGNTAAPEDNGVKELGTLEVMPEPVGGAAAWAKFLQKNLRFPAVAQEQGVSGKVLLSFIIEKDGSLSNIKIERGAGYGFDEEALRVLKLAKAWKPGIQNNQPVRVRYNIPINFQLSE